MHWKGKEEVLAKKGLCVDLDGTLIDTERLHVRAERRALRRLRVSQLTDDHPITFGAALEPGAVELCQHYGIDVTRYLAEYLPLWNRSIELELELMPGAKSLLEACNQMRVPIALVTSGSAHHAAGVTRRLEIDRFFASVITSESVR